MGLLSASALATLDRALLSRLGQRLRSDGYDDEVLAVGEAIAPRQLDAVRLPLVLRTLRARDDAPARWARLFAYGDGLTETEATASGLRDLLDDLAGSGLLRRRDTGWEARVRIMPFGGILIASDEATAADDPVMGPGATTWRLAQAMGAPQGTVLDVGCGAGSLALLAKHRGARAVAGVDLDPRAIAFAQLNAHLNELDAEFLAGDLLAPVAGRTFDFVVAQPPFVPRPEGMATTTYLHGGSRGDELTARLLGECDAVLHPGARALVLFDAPSGSRPVADRVREVIEGKALRAVVAVTPGHSADELSIGYAAALDPTLGGAYRAAATRYRDHLAALGITGVHQVLVELTAAPTGPHYTVGLEAPRERPWDAAALTETRAALALAIGGEHDLASARLTLAPGMSLVHVQPSSASEPATWSLRFSQGRARDQEVSEASVALLEVLGRTGSVAEAIDEYAVVCRASPDAVRPGVLRFVRDALLKGMLIAAPAP